MQILKFPKQNYKTREAVNNMAEASVNTDAPELGLEVLRTVDRQLEAYNMEIVIFDNGEDTLIWKLRPRDETRPMRVPVPKPAVSTRTTSDRVSSLAAAFLGMSDDKVRQEIIDSNEFISSLRSIAASALAQDEEPRRR